MTTSFLTGFCSSFCYLGFSLGFELGSSSLVFGSTYFDLSFVYFGFAA